MLGCKENMVFIAQVEYRGIIILLDLEIQKKKKSIIISVVGPWCGQCGHFPGKNILSFSKKKKKKRKKKKKKKQLHRHGPAYQTWGRNTVQTEYKHVQ